MFLHIDLFVFRYSATSLQYTSVPKNVAEKIELNMSNASMPLLNRLLKDRAFIKVKSVLVSLL